MNIMLNPSLADTLNLPQPLKVWEKVVIIVGEGPDAGTYITRIEDFVQDSIRVTNPEFVSGNILLRDDIPVLVQITRDDAIYQFEAVIKRDQSMPGDHVLLIHPHDARRVQRRLFVRIGVSEQVQWAAITPVVDWMAWRSSLKWNDTMSHDVSGGGVRISAKELMSIGTLALCKLAFFRPSGLPEYIFAVCRRTIPHGSDTHAGLEFLTADRIDRNVSAIVTGAVPPELRQFDRAAQNKLVMWVFQRQVELRQRGLL